MAPETIPHCGITNVGLGLGFELGTLYAAIGYVSWHFLRPMFLRILTGYLLFLLQVGIHIRRLILIALRRFEMKIPVWKARAASYLAEFNWKNMRKLARVFNVLEPLPTDLIPVNEYQPVKGLIRPSRNPSWKTLYRSPEWDMPSLDGPEGVEHVTRVPYGHARVVLRFRHGDLQQRLHGKENWAVVSMKYSVTRDLPLERDGSLKVERICEAFHIGDVDFLKPDSYDLFEPAREDKISKWAIFTLSEKFGAIHIIEREDIFCRMRRKFRFWLRSSLVSYIIRSALYSALFGALRALLMLCMTMATSDLLQAYVVFVAKFGCIEIIAQANVALASLLVGGYGWRYFDLFASRMGLQKLVPKRRMKHWSKQVEKLIY